MTKEKLKLIIKTTLLSILQFILWLLIFEVSTWLILNFYTPRRLSSSNSFGYYHLIILSWVVFGLVILFSNTIIGLYINKVKNIIIFYLTLISINFFLFIRFYEYVPYRTIHFIGIGTLSLLCGLPIMLKIIKNNK